MRIYTIGHSTCTADEFRSLLDSFGITLLVDIRIAPGSRRHPHFARKALAGGVAEVGIG